MSTPLVAETGADRRRWQPHGQVVSIDGVARSLRLVEFDRGWLASVDTDSGPTLGMDRSPYLAAHRALEPLGLGIVEAMTLVGPLVGSSSGGRVR